MSLIAAWLRSASVVPWLLPTLAGNVAFCAFLPLYLSQHLGLLTPLGRAWFAGELGILAAVVGFEVTVLTHEGSARGPSVWMLANIENKLLMATSNRSEAAVGYATMDGDTSGGISPIASEKAARYWS